MANHVHNEEILETVSDEVLLQDQSLSADSNSESFTDSESDEDLITPFARLDMNFTRAFAEGCASIDRIATLLRSKAFTRVVVMSGAGLSVSAGIPDFRSPGTGLYSQLAHYDLPKPEAIFDIEFFRSNPRPFYTLAKEIWPGHSQYRPTVGHMFIRLLHEKNLLLRSYTQNIDGLERLAGLPASSLVEAHGTFATSSCPNCGRPEASDTITSRFDTEPFELPLCLSCGDVIKPDIVFFGESLPERFCEMVTADFKACDLLIVMGTSLSVHPFASLVNLVPKSCPRLLINREKVGESGDGFDSDEEDDASNMLDRRRDDSDGFVFDGRGRDTFFQGDCDVGARRLAQLCGWNDDLQALEEEICSMINT